MRSILAHRRPTRRTAMTPELQALVEMLRKRLHDLYPNDPRNDVPPFATGVE
jgi:hypothetical protein